MKLLAKGIVTVDPKAKTVNIPMPPGTDILIVREIAPGDDWPPENTLELYMEDDAWTKKKEERP